MKKLSLFSALALSAQSAKTMKGSADADYGYQPCYQWDEENSDWKTDSLISVTVESGPKQSKHRFLITLGLEYSSNTFVYQNYCDQNLYHDFRVEWTVADGQVEGNYGLYYTEGTWDKENKLCVLGYANEASTPYVSATEMEINKRKGACGYNLLINFEDYGGTLAGTTEILIHSDNALMGALSSLVLLASISTLF